MISLDNLVKSPGFFAHEKSLEVFFKDKIVNPVESECGIMYKLGSEWIIQQDIKRFIEMTLLGEEFNPKTFQMPPIDF